MHLGFLRRELGENAAEAKRVLAEIGAHPVVARGRGIAFVEDEIDDFEHRRQSRVAIGAARHLERDALFRERLLGADDALRDGGFGDEKRARDFVGRQAAEKPQRQRGARLRRQHRMAGGEDEPQQIVAHIIIERRLELARERLLPLFEVVPELLVLAIEHFGAAEMIDRAMLGGRHQPGAGVVRNARCRPLLERRHERIVREIFGQPDVAHHARQGRNDLRGFDAPDGVDGAMGVGSRHGYRSSAAVTATDHTSFTRPVYDFCLLELLADLLVVLDGRTRGEVFELEERAELDFPILERHPLGPLDGLFFRLHLDDPEAGDQLLGLGKRTVDDRPLAARVLDAGALASSA